MPLEHSQSKGAFKENVRTEIRAGKPIPQAVANRVRRERKHKHTHESKEMHHEPHKKHPGHAHIKRAHKHMHSALKALEHAHSMEAGLEGKVKKAHHAESKAMHALPHKR